MSEEKDRIRREHRSKLIAPIIITVILGLYFIGFSVMCLFIPYTPVVVKILMFFIPLALAAVTVYVLIERIREIRSGEEDDLSKY